jgi:hypothetical protein
MGRTGYLRQGASLAGNRKRYLAWLYAASLGLAGIAAAAAAHQAGAVLDHSLAADRLLHGFDVATLIAVLMNPGVSTSALSQLSTAMAALYFLAVLFLTPGIVYSFVHGEPPSTAALFRRSGEYFWAFVRMTLWTALIALPTLGALNAGRRLLLKAVNARTGDERIALAVSLATLAVIVVVAYFLRLWFDLAEFHLVRRADRATRKTLRPAWRALCRAPGRLFAIHFACALAGGVVFAFGAWVWWHLPSPAVGLAMLVGQVMTMALIAARYWQRASEAAWFSANVPEEAPIALAAPLPAEPPPAEPAPPLGEAPAPGTAE